MSWRDEIDIALQEWIAASGGDRGGERWQRIGRARRDGAPGHFAVDIRSANLSPDQADDLRLAGPDEEGISAQGFPVLDAVFDGGSLRVRVAEFAAPPEPCLWLRRPERSFLVERLRDGLASLPDTGLAGLLARGEVGGVPSAVSPPAWLRAGQQDAYRACLGEGLWLVWSPPGTGKTRVIRAAVGDLLAAGKRVLLVSGTNIAVDNALLEVLKERRFEPGEIVRVGPPELTEIAGHPGVGLPLLVRAKLAQAEEKRRAAAEELRAMDGRKERLQALEAKLGDFDPAAYAAAVALLATPGGLVPELHAAMIACEEEIENCGPALETAREERDAAFAAVAEADPVRPVWAEVEHLEADLAGLDEHVMEVEVRALKAKAAADAAAEQVAALQPDGKVRWRDRRDHADAQRRLTERLEEYEDRYAAAEDARRAAQARRRSSERKIEEKEATAALGRAEIVRRDRAAEQARMRVRVLDQAQRTRLAQRTKLRAAQVAAREAEDLVSACRQRGWPEMHAEARDLRGAIMRDSAMRAGVEARHNELQAEYERMAQDSRGELITGARLVATTLARFRLVKAVFDGPYDVVLIDDAGAATLPELVLAVAKAGKCAVMFGDFMQLGPILPDALERSDRAEIRTWLSTGPFRHCGISTPEEARTSASCLVLDTQRRFGPDVMRLANLLAYDGLLTAGPGVRAHAEGDPELVLIDTDGLNDLAQVQQTGDKGRWWPAGPLLSRTLVEMHRDKGEVSGVITPYRTQAEVTLDALRDVEPGETPLADAGTAHRFQGRELPVVVFDPVVSEFGRPTWIARASRLPGSDDREREGVRLFNVAATCVTDRLYVIASRQRVMDARPGTALGHFGALVRDGRVPSVRAMSLITPSAWEPVPLGLEATALAQVLARHIEVTDTGDEKSFYEHLAALLDQAGQSIWIWSPWVANRVYRLLPRLQDAARRGVKITVFTRDPGDKSQGTETSVTALNALGAVAQVVEMNVAHQKLIVIDDHTVMMGSLNALSRHRSREVMITTRGRHLARRLLAELHAEAFTTPPACAACGERQVDLRRGENGYYWRCRSKTCPAYGKGAYKAWTQQVDLAPRRR